MSRTLDPNASETLHPDAWHFLVLRSQNWQHLRPERAWRPIVTLEVDGRPSHELCLGSDGQNPNLRVPMFLHNAHDDSQVNISLWYKGASKAKSKKRRQLVASTTVRLGDAYSKQGTERRLELRLVGIPAVRRKSASQKAQPCTSLFVRLRPPSTTSPSSSTTLVDDDSLSQSVGSLGRSLSDASSDTSPSDPELEDPPPPSTLRRRKRVKGFRVDSSDEASSEYLSSGPTSPTSPKPAEPWPPSPQTPPSSSTIFLLPPRAPSEPAIVCPPSTLPLAYVTDTASVVSTASATTSVTTVSVATSVFDTLTYYRELRSAQVDSDLEALLERLMHEWYYVGASLLSIAALGTTVFGFSPDSIFGVDGLAKRAMTVCTVSAALGLSIDASFIFLYSGADVVKFKTLSLDIYNTYIFFSLTSRLPLLALLLSALTLALFLVSVAWAAWPTAVLVLSFSAGVLLCLQFLVYGCQQAVLGVVWGVRAVWRGVRFVGWRVRSLVGGAREGEGETGETGETGASPMSMVSEPAGAVAVPMSEM